MSGIYDFLILLSFFIEIAVLFYLEIKAWKTLYTPLVFLMLPYTIILLISIAISGNFGFVEFYYPSIFFWSVGLLIFAIPSYIMAFLLHKNNMPLNSTIKETSMPKLVSYIALFIILLFAWHFKSMFGGAAVIGTDEFGEEFSGRGVWGHMRQFALPILIAAIYFVNKERKWLWLIIIPLLGVALLYMVLGWVIIPCLAGVALRLYSGKTKLKLRLLLYVVLGVMAVFLGSYIMSLVVAKEDGELNNEVLSFIFRNFIHYLTSGTLGLSVDMERGFPDAGEFDLLIAQVINIGKVVSGNSDYVDIINPFFYNTGFNLTNVRTLFGTIFINSDYITFVIYVLFLSSSMYFLKLATIRFNNIFVYICYFFECGLLFMGWFESYFATLPSLEIPAMSLVIMLLCKIFSSKHSINMVSKNVIEKL